MSVADKDFREGMVAKEGRGARAGRSGGGATSTMRCQRGARVKGLLAGDVGNKARESATDKSEAPWHFETWCQWTPADEIDSYEEAGTHDGIRDNQLNPSIDVLS